MPRGGSETVERRSGKIRIRECDPSPVKLREALLDRRHTVGESVANGRIAIGRVERYDRATGITSGATAVRVRNDTRQRETGVSNSLLRHGP